MSLKVLGISSSPRIKGSSDLLLREALAGAESAGAVIEYVRLCDLKIAPCQECNFCYQSGRCQVEDDYQILSAKMLAVGGLIFATPVFFMTVCAQAKMLIDRCQCLWAAKHILKRPLITSRDHRRAMVIAVGGSASKKMFDNIRMTMKTYFDVLDMHYMANLFVNKVNDPGEIEKHPSALNEAFRLGRELAAGTMLLSERPIEVKLI